MRLKGLITAHTVSTSDHVQTIGLYPCGALIMINKSYILHLVHGPYSHLTGFIFYHPCGSIAKCQLTMIPFLK